MRPTADRTSEPTLPPEAGVSGKLVIIGILTVALVAAATSWWFRYYSTHQAAVFWGSQAARLIRDAPLVELLKLAPSTSVGPTNRDVEIRGETYRISHQVDVSSAHGMAHLRNALLEDRSFDAFNVIFESTPHYWRWALKFRAENESITVLFAETCTAATLEHGAGAVASCEPIAAGLAEMFAEFSSAPAAESAAPAR